MESRNVRKTEKSMENAILSLIEIKPYWSISVRVTIVKAENVFYNL